MCRLDCECRRWRACDTYEHVLDGEDLTLEVNGLLQNTAADCEVIPGKILLQAEGAYIEFRKVQLRPIIGHE